MVAQVERIPFPILSDLFATDKKLVRKIKSLESYHEILYDMIDVQQAIIAINSVSPQDVPAGVTAPPSNSDELLEAYEAILDDELVSSRGSTASIFNDVQDLKSKYSTSSILAYLCPNFLLSTERLLTGAVVTYVKAFNSSTGRSKLDADEVFGKSSDLRSFHRRLSNLRDKHFAHADFQANRHYLQYLRDPDSKEIDLEDEPPHVSVKFYEAVSLIEFNKCAVAVVDFLRSQVKGLNESILSSLSEEQLITLKTIDCEEAFKLSTLKSHSIESSRC